MYKVYFDTRYAVLHADFSPDLEEEGRLFYRVGALQDLREVLLFFMGSRHIPSLHLYHPDLELLMEWFNSCFENIRAGGGVVRRPGGDFLVIRRNGTWDLPKGKLEAGEDFEGAALREVGEETGLAGLEILHSLVSTFHTYALGDRKVLKETRWFEMTCEGNGPPVLQEEEGITDFRWVGPGEGDFLLENTWPSVLDVLRLKSLL